MALSGKTNVLIAAFIFLCPLKSAASQGETRLNSAHQRAPAPKIVSQKRVEADAKKDASQKIEPVQLRRNEHPSFEVPFCPPNGSTIEMTVEEAYELTGGKDYVYFAQFRNKGFLYYMFTENQQKPRSFWFVTPPEDEEVSRSFHSVQTKFSNLLNNHMKPKHSKPSLAFTFLPQKDFDADSIFALGHDLSQCPIGWALPK